MQTDATCPASSHNSNGSDPEAFAAVMVGQNNNNLQGDQNDWSHPCPYCSKTFETSQALGGHQNAHRREREADRREYLANRRAFRLSRPSASVHHSRSAPLLSMLPHNTSTPFGLGYGYGYGHGPYGYGAPQVGFPTAPAAGLAWEANRNNNNGGFLQNNSVYAPNCRYCYDQFYNNNINAAAASATAAARPVEYKFLPPAREEHRIRGKEREVVVIEESVSSELRMNIHHEHEVEVNSNQRRLDLTLRL